MSHNGKYYKKTLKRNAVMSRNIASMSQPKVLRTNDSSNAVLNNNQVLYNNPTSVVKTNSSEKEITNAEEHQESGSNDSQSETLQIFENLNSTENVSEPEFDISCSIGTAKELLLSKPHSSTTPDGKESKESKLVSYEICFPDFYFSSVENGWLCKICCSFSHGNAGNRAFVDKPGKLGEHPLAKFSDQLNSNRHKLSVKNKQCFKEMSIRNTNVWQLAFNASLQSGETKRQNNRFILKCFFKITFLMIRKNWAHIHNFRDIIELVVDCGAKEISSHLLTAPKNAKYLSPLYASKYIETKYMSNYIE